jgi:hypothetical protein
MEEDTRLRLEYDSGSELLRGLTETRFRLLALAPRARALGVVPVSRTAALALVYGAALGGWGYLVGWGALRAAGATGGARPGGLAIGAAFGLLVALEIARLERSG